MKPRAKHIPRRPQDEPMFTNPTSLDFEKRQLVVTQVSGSTVQSMMSTISDAIVCYDGVVVSYDGDAVYKL